MFKLWLESRENVYSWLSPTGKFFPVPINSNHSIYANQLTNLKYPFSMEKLFENKWFRIYFYKDQIVAHNNIYQLNDQQKNKLIELALEENFDFVIIDNEVKERVVWSRDEKF